MKKKLLTILSILILSSTIGTTSAKTSVSSDLAGAIKLYKEGNYTQCYTTLADIAKKEPSNALVYYYLALAATQVGNQQEAITNYEKTLTLAAPNTNLATYAKKGKVCLETPDKCQASVFETELEEFIHSKKREKLSNTAKSEYEKLKIENMMREMNRNDNIAPQRFKEYKDFSSYNTEKSPSNDEIVAAIRTLQRAGLTSGMNDFSLLTGAPTSQNSMLNLMGSSSLNPQVIQALFSNNMSLGF